MIKQRKTSESSQDSVETDNLLPRDEYLEQKAPKINLSKTIKRITKGLAILGNPRAIKNY